MKIILDSQNSKKPHAKCKGICLYWILTLRNDHIWLGICCRNQGTHYSHNQRISVMMVRLLTTMAVCALFYGRSKGNTVGDISLLFYESIMGFIPMFILEKLIKDRTPTSNEFEKHKNYDEKEKHLSKLQDIKDQLKQIYNNSLLSPRQTNRESRVSSIFSFMSRSRKSTKEKSINLNRDSQINSEANPPAAARVRSRSVSREEQSHPQSQSPSPIEINDQIVIQDAGSNPVAAPMSMSDATSNASLTNQHVSNTYTATLTAGGPMAGEREQGGAAGIAIPPAIDERERVDSSGLPTALPDQLPVIPPNRRTTEVLQGHLER